MAALKAVLGLPVEQSRMANAARGKLPPQVRARGVACPPPHPTLVPSGARGVQLVTGRCRAGLPARTRLPPAVCPPTGSV
jgi:hypothetical protein